MLSCADRGETTSITTPTNDTKSSYFSKGEPEPRTVNIGIFEVTIHRASKSCTSGFGFCNFEWFPGEPDIPPFKMPDIPKEQDEYLGRRTVVVFKNIGEENYYFDVYATEYIEEEFPDLIVDDNLIAIQQGEMDSNLTIRAGVYSFDRNIGEFGGYRIPLY